MRVAANRGLWELCLAPTRISLRDRKLQTHLARAAALSVVISSSFTYRYLTSITNPAVHAMTLKLTDNPGTPGQT